MTRYRDALGSLHVLSTAGPWTVTEHAEIKQGKEGVTATRVEQLE